MKTFRITRSVVETWQVQAEDEDEALEKYSRGEAKLVDTMAAVPDNDGELIVEEEEG